MGWKHTQHGYSGRREDHIPSRMEWNGATQNDAHFKIYELFISGIFHLIFWDHGWPRVIETRESKTTDKEDFCISLSSATPLLNHLKGKPRRPSTAQGTNHASSSFTGCCIAPSSAIFCLDYSNPSSHTPLIPPTHHFWRITLKWKSEWVPLPLCPIITTQYEDQRSRQDPMLLLNIWPDESDSFVPRVVWVTYLEGSISDRASRRGCRGRSGEGREAGIVVKKLLEYSDYWKTGKRTLSTMVSLSLKSHLL